MDGEPPFDPTMGLGLPDFGFLDAPFVSDPSEIRRSLSGGLFLPGDAEQPFGSLPLAPPQSLPFRSPSEPPLAFHSASSAAGLDHFMHDPASAAGLLPLSLQMGQDDGEDDNAAVAEQGASVVAAAAAVSAAGHDGFFYTNDDEDEQQQQQQPPSIGALLLDGEHYHHHRRAAATAAAALPTTAMAIATPSRRTKSAAGVASNRYGRRSSGSGVGGSSSHHRSSGGGEEEEEEEEEGEGIRAPVPLQPMGTPPSKRRRASSRATTPISSAAAATAQRNEFGIIAPLPHHRTSSKAVLSPGLALHSLATPVLGMPNQLGIHMPTECSDRGSPYAPTQFPTARLPLVGLLDPEQQSKLNKVLHNVLTQLQRADSAKLFHEPVDERVHPDYYNLISNPIDIKTMRERVKASLYHSLSELAADIGLMVSNGLAYHRHGSSQRGSVKQFRSATIRVLEKQREKLDVLLLGDLSQALGMPLESEQYDSERQHQQVPRPRTPARSKTPTAATEPGTTPSRHKQKSRSRTNNALPGVFPQEEEEQHQQQQQPLAQKQQQRHKPEHKPQQQPLQQQQQQQQQGMSAADASIIAFGFRPVLVESMRRHFLPPDSAVPVPQTPLISAQHKAAIQFDTSLATAAPPTDMQLVRQAFAPLVRRARATITAPCSQYIQALFGNAPFPDPRTLPPQLPGSPTQERADLLGISEALLSEILIAGKQPSAAANSVSSAEEDNDGGDGQQRCHRPTSIVRQRRCEVEEQLQRNAALLFELQLAQYQRTSGAAVDKSELETAALAASGIAAAATHMPPHAIASEPAVRTALEASGLEQSLAAVPLPLQQQQQQHHHPLPLQLQLQQPAVVGMDVAPAASAEFEGLQHHAPSW